MVVKGLVEKVNAKLKAAGDEYTIAAGNAETALKISKKSGQKTEDTTVTVTFKMGSNNSVTPTFNK